ncbi:DUF4179 domain-containing protein [Bacillus sp. FJAT-22090]|uniref:DUF4179 domain-containing protein n=1 Tax=Bacillus sp. FJAT-22090 TaxID=1581038 RepID=UPI00119E7A0A|nr:DUF4179 domain-containing protein [Bacillus sp. FJAT-22090]
MVPIKIEPTIKIREIGVESFVDWLEEHQQSFYILCRCYISNPLQIEELFYETILKVQKELPRLKNKSLFKTWITSIFIHSCREFSRDKMLQVSDGRERHQSIFNALDQLQQTEKESLVLTYILVFSTEEAAYLLQISVAKMKELLFSGMQSLRNELWSESTFHGCLEYQQDYLDYLGQTIDRSKKIDLEVHIYQCEACQEELATFQEVISTKLNLTKGIEDFHMPSDFMMNVKEKVIENERHRQLKEKKRKRVGLIIGSVLVLLIGIGFFTGTVSYLYYSWTEEDPQLRPFLQQGIGQRLNLEAENNGVKIKIKSVIADDIQTLVFYEIEDTVEDSQYMMNYDDGIIVENEYEIMSHTAFTKYYPPDLESELNSKEKSVYHGMVSLLPLTTEKGSIKLKIIKLHKLMRDSSEPQRFWDYRSIENKTGEWNFEIPVKKQPSTEYVLHDEIKIEGIPIRFEKLIIAPTVSIIHYGINNAQPEKQMGSLNFNNLEVNNTKLKADLYGSSYWDSQQDNDWSNFQVHFDPFFGGKPKEVNVQLESVHLTFEDKKIIELDDTKNFPQTFDYAGSTISIDKLEDGQFTDIVISNHEVKNRAYDMLQFNFLKEDGRTPSAIEMDSEGVIVDKAGVEYNMNQTTFSYEKIEQPRYFYTVQSNRFYEMEIPNELDIYGYYTLKYIDDVVKISLK